MNKVDEEKLDIELRKKLGSSNVVDWMRECMEPIEKQIARLRKRGDSLFHIEFMDIDDFKVSVERYAKDHPNAEIQATGFMFSSKEPNRTKKYKYRKK